MLQNATGASATCAGAMQTKYGCQTCGIDFNGSEAQRAHMRGDWHVYNLKQRIASEPTISLTTFQEQILPAQSGKDDSGSFDKSCDACKQRYTNRKDWKAHLQSINHTLRAAGLESEPSISSGKLPLRGKQPADGGESDLDDEDEEAVEEVFSPSECLFCNIESPSLDSNISHMSQVHGFAIPDADSLIDVESFLSYLFAIISVFHECLFCGSLRDSKSGVQSHMRDKGHCKLNFDDDEHDIREFYEFTDDEAEGEEEEEEEALGAVIDGDEMRLPSGKTLGHRSQIRNSHRKAQREVPPGSATLERSPDEPEAGLSIPLRPESKDRSLAIRAGTSTSLIGVSQLQQRALFAVEKKTLKVETIAKTKYQMRIERGANRQKRFKVKSIGKKQGGLEKRLG